MNAKVNIGKRDATCPQLRNKIGLAVGFLASKQWQSDYATLQRA